MSITFNSIDPSPSENSIVYKQLINEKNKELVGSDNPIILPLLNYEIIKHTIGEKITEGNTGSIHRVKNCTSRVYKVIAQDEFVDGDEIRISKIASDKGVAPTFYSAFLVDQGSENVVVIEMDDAGKSLGKLMEYFADNTVVEDTDENKIEKGSLTEFEKYIREIQSQMKEKMQSEMDDFTITPIVQKKKLSMDETIDKIYKSQEIFYYALFNKIKILAENKIAYTDTHVGNIMPNYDNEKGLQIIDFGGAAVMNDIKSAACKSIFSFYTMPLYIEFDKLSKSSESKNLIDWFKKAIQ